MQYVERFRTLTLFFSGCNFRCPYCYNPSLMEFRKDTLMNVRDIKKVISDNRDHIDAVMFAGGEPSLQRQGLIDIARYCQMHNLRTILHTNASRPDTLKALKRESLIDLYRVGIKAPYDDTFERVTKSRTFFKDDVCKDVKLGVELLSSIYGDTVKAFTPIVPGFIYRKEDVFKIAKIVNRMTSEWVFEPFIPGRSLEQRMDSIRAPKKSFCSHLRRLCSLRYPGLSTSIL